MRVTADNFTWFFDHAVTCGHLLNKKLYISSSKKPIKFGRVMAFGKGLPRKKLHNPVITHSWEVTWLMKSDISGHPWHPRPPNVTRCWLMIRAFTTRRVKWQFDHVVTWGQVKNGKHPFVQSMWQGNIAG